MIRNKPAYLMGILRKYKQGQRGPAGNGASAGVGAGVPGGIGAVGNAVRMGVSWCTSALPYQERQCESIEHRKDVMTSQRKIPALPPCRIWL